MKQKMSEFLFDISQTYPIRGGLNAEKVLEDTRTYLVGKCYKKEFDFDKAKSLIFDEYKQKTFPLPKEILGYLLQAEVKSYKECADEGDLIVITLPNGVIYDFTVCASGRNINTITDELKFKYGTFEIKQYPKGSVLMGREVVLP